MTGESSVTWKPTTCTPPPLVSECFLVSAPPPSDPSPSLAASAVSHHASSSTHVSHDASFSSKFVQTDDETQPEKVTSAEFFRQLSRHVVMMMMMMMGIAMVMMMVMIMMVMMEVIVMMMILVVMTMTVMLKKMPCHRCKGGCSHR